MAKTAEELNHIAMQAPASFCNGFRSWSNAAGFRIAFMEFQTVDGNEEVAARCAVSMAIGDAVLLRDYLMEVLKDVKPISPGPDTRQ